MNHDKTPSSRAHKWLDSIRTWGGLFGLGVAALSVVGMLVMFWATNKQVERANQRVADLLVRLGGAEERAAQVERKCATIEQQVASVDDVVQRLLKVDRAQLREVLELAEKPGTKQLLQAGELQRQVSVLARQVGTIYYLADYSVTDDVVYPSLTFPMTLRQVWHGSKTLQQQRADGTIPAEWDIDDKEADHIKAQALNMVVAMNLDNKSRSVRAAGRASDREWDKAVKAADERLEQSEKARDGR
ncbi:MAG: hypothetical protein QOF78_789 [Phycisphaerales bacterium]|jgi:hypothetical protein|nr:hypothetical protein [Phycisphaerales bacterium]